MEEAKVFRVKFESNIGFLTHKVPESQCICLCIKVMILVVIKDDILELFLKGGSLVTWKSFNARYRPNSGSGTFWLYDFQDSCFSSIKWGDETYLGDVMRLRDNKPNIDI